MRLEETTITEGRRNLPQLVKKVAGSGEDEVVVVICKRGLPQAALVSVAELRGFFRWRSEQNRAQTEDSQKNERREQETIEDVRESPAAPEGFTQQADSPVESERQLAHTETPAARPPTQEPLGAEAPVQQERQHLNDAMTRENADGLYEISLKQGMQSQGRVTSDGVSLANPAAEEDRC